MLRGGFGPALWAGFIITLLATALFLGGSAGVPPWDGVYLFRDFVTVPDPVLGANTLGGGGAPRAVPLDAVVAAFSIVLPAGLVARVLLVAPLLLVGSGMTVLLRRYGPVATSVAAGLAIANPYVAERLLLGQAPSLLGYAMIPWLVVAVRSSKSLRVRALLVLAAAAPAALTPVGAVMAALTVLVTALAVGQTRPRTDQPSPRGEQASRVGQTSPRRWVVLNRRRQLRDGQTAPLSNMGGRASEVAVLLALVALLSLPWVIAGLQDPSAGTSPDGADAFAVRSDGPLGLIGSVATLGGVWASGATPASRDNLAPVLLQLLLVVGALLAWSTAAERVWLARTVPVPTQRALDLAAAAYLGTVVSVLLLAGPLMPVWRAAQQVPGVALLRDTHRWLGWAALGVAVLFALGLAVAVDRLRWSRWVAAGLSLTAVALAVLTVPDVPGRLARDLHPVAVPAEWHHVVDLLTGEAEGRVLLLPWQPFRQVDWVGPTQFLDPFPRALEAEVVHARDLLVRRGDQQWLVGGEDPEIAADLAGPDGALDPALLRAQGISHVLIWVGSPGELPRGGGAPTGGGSGLTSDGSGLLHGDRELLRRDGETPSGDADLRPAHIGENWMVLEVP